MDVTNKQVFKGLGHRSTLRSGDAMADPLRDPVVDPLRATPVQAKARPGASAFGGAEHDGEEEEDEGTDEPSADDATDVQAMGGAHDTLSSRRVHDVAGGGVSGRGHALPHGERIQAAFGSHDVSAVRAHTDGAAARANRDLGSQAYASGDHVAFGTPSPDLHTAAHEAAHVVQQRGGVQLKDKVGQVGDPYERHADAVADAVVAGRSAQPLLDAHASPGRSAGAEAGAVTQKKAGWGSVASSFLGSEASRAANTALGEGRQSSKTEDREQAAGTGVQPGSVDGQPVAQGPEVDQAVPITGHLQTMFKKDEFKQIPPKKGGTLLAALVEAFQGWLTDPANRRGKTLEKYAKERQDHDTAIATIEARRTENKKQEAQKAKDLAKEKKSRDGVAAAFDKLTSLATAEGLAGYHVTYTCNAFTQFLLTRGGRLQALQSAATDYDAFKDAVKRELVDYYTGRLKDPKQVRWDGWVSTNIGTKGGESAGWRGDKNEAPKEIQRGAKESEKKWKQRQKKREAEMRAHDREQGALQEYTKRSGKPVDSEEARKAAQLLQFEGQSVLIHVKQASYDKKTKKVSFRKSDHFFLGYVTKGKNPELQTYDHQNNPLRVGPFPLFDLLAPENGHYFWATFQKATPKG